MRASVGKSFVWGLVAASAGMGIFHALEAAETAGLGPIVEIVGIAVVLGALRYVYVRYTPEEAGRQDP